MIRRCRVRRRTGGATIESVMVLSTLLTLIFTTIVGGYGVFRYQQVALLAREGARYASVHGGQYAQETGNAAATAQDIYNNGIAPYAVSLDLSQLTYSVSWSNNNNMPNSVSASGDYVYPKGNMVTVTVHYKWFPEVYLAGPITLSSTSTLPMSY